MHLQHSCQTQQSLAAQDWKVIRVRQSLHGRTSKMRLELVQKQELRENALPAHLYQRQAVRGHSGKAIVWKPEVDSH